MSDDVALTSEQEEVVALRDGSYLVLAPPGAGKTEVIAQRVVRLLEEPSGASYRVLALTYNNRAASSLRRRVSDRLGAQSRRATIETYHAFYLDMLRNYGSVIGVPPEVTVYDTVDARIQALAQGLEEEGFVISGDELDRTAVVELLDEISRLQRALVPVSAAPDRRTLGGFSLRDAYSAYEGVLRRNGAVDFDSMLTRAYELLTDHPQVARHFRRIYRFILVDEAQDTSTIQFELLRALCGEEHRNVFMVADPDQLINRWLGADKKNLDRFVRDFDAREYHLSTNFRCADSIVEVANRLLAGEHAESDRTVSPAGNAPGWIGAYSFASEAAEASAVTGWAAQLVDQGLPTAWLAATESSAVTAEDVAILARSRLQLGGVLAELESRGVPYFFRAGDSGPFDTDLYCAALDCLKVLANPRDVAMRRALLAQLSIASELETKEIEAWSDVEVAEFLRQVGEREGGSFGKLAEALGRATDVEAAMKAFTEPTEEEAKASDLGERLGADRELLVDRWKRYCATHESRNWSWGGVIMGLIDEPRDDPGGFRVSTVHAAKGLEFRAVAIVGLNEGSFPDFRNVHATDEVASERRLAYVGVTRAARGLLLTRPRSRTTRYGNVRTQDESRFLGEMGIVMDER
jgi:DNA helicase II / ATP-dependent DNA helicase PcrA